MQDTVPFVTGNRDLLHCLVCSHVCVVPIEDTAVKNETNVLVLVAHEANTRRWNLLPESTCGGKPKKEATSSQLLGCYCFQMNSLLKLSGRNCVNCGEVAAAAGLNLEQDKGGYWRSTCKICACLFQVTYQRGNCFKIALKLKREKRKGTTTEDFPEDSVSYSHSVINLTLVDATLDAALDAGKMIDSKKEHGGG